jgi:ornithine cyclodeaminase
MRWIPQKFLRQPLFHAGVKEQQPLRSMITIPHQAMFVLGERDVRKALDPLQCLQITKQALVSLTDKSGLVPTRLALPYPNNPNAIHPLNSSSPSITVVAQDWTLIKPAAYYPPHRNDSGNHQAIPDNDVTMGLKVVSVRADNPMRGLPLVPATILLLDPLTGVIYATLAGTYITAMRTSAGPALAVQAFQPHAQHLVMFGAGTQAECHIQLMELSIQRRIPKITIVNRTLHRAERLRTKIENFRNNQTFHTNNNNNNRGGTFTIELVELANKEAVASALSTADVVSATTNATTPLWKDEEDIQLKKGCLLTGIGSYTPDMQEIPKSVVNRSVVVIDTPEAIQVGDLNHLGATMEEAIAHHPIFLAGHALHHPEIVVKQRQSARKDFVFYKAVGTAIQDILQATAVVAKAKMLKLGQEVDMS